MAEPSQLEQLESQVKKGPLPRHIGIIMDGNGRWAESRGLDRLVGHKEGSESVRAVTRAARRLGVRALTLYAFSAQNWSRPADEIAGLMDLLREYLISERPEILDNGIRLNAIGELDRLPQYVREPLEGLREVSAKNNGLTLTLALSYGGREEIVHATKSIARSLAKGELQEDSLGEREIEAALWTSGLPPVDLVIRTSGERRISNFMLWQVAYAELVFVEALWPDFRAAQLVECLLEFQQRERRFGQTSAQVAAQLPK